MSLRKRVALWCAGLVVLSGVIVVTIVVVFAGRFLHERAREADQQLRSSNAAASSAPAAPPPAGGPLPGGAQGNGQGDAAGRGPTVQDRAHRAAADQTFEDVRLIGFASVAGLAVVAVGASWVVAGHLVRQLRKVTDTAASISEDSRLDRRIAYEGAGDEIDELAQAFDRMLDRLEAVFDAQRSFVSNTSHELRTPLAAMRAEVDVALDDPSGDPRELRRALEAVRDELGHTTGLVGSMLSLARAEAITDPRPFDLAEGAERALELVDASWQAGHDVRMHVTPTLVQGDPVLLQQLLGNLVSNAAKYNRSNGMLRVEVATVGGAAQVVVENDGPIVDPATIDALFARFVRRSEQGEGYGLGLAIVHTIVDTHGGTIRATARPAGGLRIEVSLPLAG